MPGSDFADRLDALESRKLVVADLPIAALQRKLEADWQPDAGVLLGQPVPRGGTGTLTFTASATSAVLTVAHGLGHVPASVVATSAVATSAEGAATLATSGWTATSFDITGDVAGAITDTIQFAWLAL